MWHPAWNSSSDQICLTFEDGCSATLSIQEDGCSDELEIVAVNVDLDIDSDNNGEILEEDDGIEEASPGRLIGLNNDDDNLDTSPDMNDAAATTSENDLVQMNLHVSTDLDGKWRLIFPSRVRVWQDATRSNPITSGALQDLPAPDPCFVEGIADSISAGDVLITLDFIPDGEMLPLCSDRVTVTVLSGNLRVFRPQTPPFQVTEVPDDDEYQSGNPAVQPGAGIRFNGDDDNENGVPDHTEAPVSSEDDLLRLEIMIPNPFILPDGYEWVLRRGDPTIQAWRTASKDFAKFFAENEEASSPIDTEVLFVEWTDPTVAQTTLELSARAVDSTQVAVFDTITVFRFQSVVIALGGEGQVPSDPTIPNYGTFQVAIDLYRDGYNVYMFDEDNVGNDGSGSVYDVVANAARNQAIVEVAVFGYSHGGGSTYWLADRLTSLLLPTLPPGTFTIPFASYVDAVGENSINAEDRYPPGVAFLLNHYQVGTLADQYLDGDAVTAPPGGAVAPAPSGLNVETTPWGAGATHTTVDDLPQVTSAIITQLKARVTH